MKLELKQTLGNVIFMAIIFILFARALSFTMGNQQPTPVSVVSSGSMQPTLYRGDIVFWTPTSIENVEEGDIIVFQSGLEEDVIISHRVEEVQDDSGRVELITKGDNNNFTDQSGPHFPEPPVTSSNYHGKVLSVGNFPFKIPFLGMLWFQAMGFFTMIMSGGIGGKGLMMIIPVLTAGVMIISLIFLFSDDEEEEEDKVKRLIIGPQQDGIKPWKIFFVIFLAFLLVLLPAYFYSYDSYSLSVGVDKNPEIADESFTLNPGEKIKGSHIVNNPGFTKSMSYIFVEGEESNWVKINETYVELNAQSRKSIKYEVLVPEDADRGTYSLTVYNYYSPFWSLYPDSFVADNLEDNPRTGYLVMSGLTAFIFALVTMIILVSFSYLTDDLILWREYIKTRRTLKDKSSLEKLQLTSRIGLAFDKIKKKLYSWTDWLRGVDVVEFDLEDPLKASSIALISIPILLLGGDLWITFILVVLASVICYFIGCRWRAEIFSASLITGFISLGILYCGPLFISFFSNQTSRYMLLTGISIFMIIFTILSPIILGLGYLSSLTVHVLRVKWGYISKGEFTDL